MFTKLNKLVTELVAKEAKISEEFDVLIENWANTTSGIEEHYYLVGNSMSGEMYLKTGSRHIYVYDESYRHLEDKLPSSLKEQVLVAFPVILIDVEKNIERLLTE